MPNDWLHYASLAITPFVYFGVIIVLFDYFPAVIKKGKPEQAAEWLLLGIVISMFSKLVDYGFWNCSWAAYLFSDPENWFAWGAPVNIVFRQLPVCVACYCHWKGYCLTQSRKDCRSLAFASVASIAMFVFLTLWAALN